MVELLVPNGVDVASGAAGVMLRFVDVSIVVGIDFFTWERLVV